MTARKQTGVTLVEVLVVALVIGLLIALLLPALQAARTAARRNQCQNRIIALGMAIARYQLDYDVFPPGVINQPGPIRNVADGYHHGWLVQILSYVEDGNLYTQFNIGRSVYDAENLTVRRARLLTFCCPEDDLSRSFSTTDGAALTSYAGCHHGTESPIDADNDGLLYLNSFLREDDIPDGRSYTLLIGESIVDPASLGWVSGTRATLHNTGSPLNAVNVASVRKGLGELSDPFWVGGFSSAHVGGVHFGYADGSVRFATVDIDPVILRRLGRRNDDRDREANRKTKGGSLARPLAAAKAVESGEERAESRTANRRLQHRTFSCLPSMSF